jgi:hypothetical protein
LVKAEPTATGTWWPRQPGLTVDLACPRCGAGANLATVEQLLGSAGATRVGVLPDGAVEVDWTGYTEVDWDSSTTIGAGCESCGWRHVGRDWPDQLAVMSSTVDEPR